MRSAGAGRNAMIKRARSKIGTTEHPPGSNKTEFGKRYGWDGVYWCNQFTWDCAYGSDNGGGILKTAAVAYTLAWGKAVGRFYSKPQAGDLAIFKNSSHIELVESYSNGQLIDIGGNTSNGAGSTSNGGGVYRNNRTSMWKRGKIIGFVRPIYGISVTEMQKIQGALGLKADGIFGPATKSAVKAFQKKNGLAADGIPGLKTYAILVEGKKADTKPSTPSKPATTKPSTPSKGKAPAFPLPRKPGAMYYYGPASGPKTSVSGKSKNTAVPGDVVKDSKGQWYSKGLKEWQKAVGLVADGRYGDKTAAKVKSLQKAYKQTQDGKLGPDTWALAWA